MSHHSYVVTSTRDTAAHGTLRSAITFANAHPGTTITFAPDLAYLTITLSHELPLIRGNDTVIDGRGAPHLTISGNDLFRVFFVGDTTDPVSGTIENLTISHALARGGDGGNGFFSGGGGAGLGGAIFVSDNASLAVSGLVLADNAAAGGNGGVAVGFSEAGGGGMGGNGGASANQVGGGGGGFGAGADGGSAGSNGLSGQFTNGAPGGNGDGPANGGANGGGGASGTAGAPLANGGGGGVGGGSSMGLSAGIGGGGGFGGGGGAGEQFGGAGGFGGGGGACFTTTGGAGGFGGGGGSGPTAGLGGFGGGSASGTGGGGGAGMGGAVFVMDGGSLVVRGAVTIAGNTVAAGTHGGIASDGSAFGDGLFLNGTGYVRFNPAAGQTEHVFNAIDDEQGVEAFLGYTPPAGFTPGSYGLIKSGKGTLVLSADNFYSGGTILKAGTLDVTGFAGLGHITFARAAKLEIGNSALLFGLGFPDVIDFFGRGDVLDLTGLHFHAGAHASYQTAGGVLTVHSGSVTDELFLDSPLGTLFIAAKDGHGGTKITLAPPHAASVASLSPHSVSAQHWIADSAGAHHVADYLIVG
jgi:hypothetical protein